MVKSHDCYMDDAFTFTVTVLHAAVTYPSYRLIILTWYLMMMDGCMVGLWVKSGSAGCRSANG